MKVLVVLPSIERFSGQSGGAIATVVRHTSRVLLDQGHEVCVLAPGDSHEPYDDVPSIPIKFTPEEHGVLFRRLVGLHRRLGQFDFHMYGLYLWQLRRALRGIPWTPDVVVYHNDIRVGRYLRRWLPEAALVLHIHNILKTKAADPLRHLAFADAVVTVSRFMRDNLAEQTGLPASRIYVAHNGVDPTEFTPGSPESGPEQPLRTLYIGRLLFDKGVDTLLEAVIQLRQEGVSITADVVGSSWWWGDPDSRDDFLHETVLPQVARAGGSWTPHTAREHLPDVYRQHDVVAVLSRVRDAFPLVTLEAFASGCIVIASDTGGIPEQVGTAGIIVKPGDTAAVAEALQTLATDHRERSRRKEESRSQAMKFTWTRTARELLIALEESVMQKRRRDTAK